MDFLRIYVWLALFDIIFAFILWFRGGAQRDKWWSLILLNLFFIMIACIAIYIDVWNNGAKIISGDCSTFDGNECFCNSPGEVDMDCFVYSSKNTLNVIVTRVVLAILVTSLAILNLIGAARFAKNNIPWPVLILYILYSFLMFVVILVYWEYTRVLRTGELSFGGVEPPVDLAFVSMLVFVLPWYYVDDNLIRAIWFIGAFISFVISYARYVPAYSTMWIILGFVMTIIVLFDKTFHKIQVATTQLNSIRITGVSGNVKMATATVTMKRKMNPKMINVTKMKPKRKTQQTRKTNTFVNVIIDDKKA